MRISTVIRHFNPASVRRVKPAIIQVSDWNVQAPMSDDEGEEFGFTFS